MVGVILASVAVQHPIHLLNLTSEGVLIEEEAMACVHAAVTDC